MGFFPGISSKVIQTASSECYIIRSQPALNNAGINIYTLVSHEGNSHLSPS